MTPPPFEDIKQFMNAAWDGDAEGLNRFIGKYPDALEITKGEPIGWTALMWASQSDKPVSVALLLDNGARIDARDRDGQTPLMMAAHRGNIETVKLLLERGADFTLRDDKGQTAADYSRKQDKTVTLVLLEAALEARRKAEAEAARAAQEVVQNAENAFQDEMRAVARSGRFRVRKLRP